MSLAARRQTGALPQRWVSSETFVVQTDRIARVLNHSDPPQAFHVSHDQTDWYHQPSRTPLRTAVWGRVHLHTQPAALNLGLRGTDVFLNDGYLTAATSSVNITEILCNVKDFRGWPFPSLSFPPLFKPDQQQPLTHLECFPEPNLWRPRLYIIL